MATIAEILTEFWKGTEWSMTGDVYSTLNWRVSNTLPKPIESDIRARSAEVDIILADRAKIQRQQSAFEDAADSILTGFEIIIQALVENKRVIDNIRSTMVTAAHTGSFTAWDTTIIDKVVNMRQKIITLRQLQ